MLSYLEPACRPARGAAVSAAVLLAGTMLSPARAADSCADVANYTLPDTAITTAQENPAANGLPAHCEVIGRINQRIGADNLPFSIGFHLRMPDDWNGRFYFQGGGGTDGTLPNSLGNGSPPGEPQVLPLGYAVISTDGGHDNTFDNDPDAGGTAAFGLDPQARTDYGYNAVDRTTLIGKSIVTSYYGRAPQYSYFDGCSNGGRQAMVASQRFPNYFDGIVAGSPGFDLPKAAVAEAWNEQALEPLATRTDVNAQPYLPDTFSDSDLQLAANAVLAACDGLDGLKDGIIDDYSACTTRRVLPQLQAVQCAGAKDASCLSGGQMNALLRIFAEGARNSEGEALYTRFPWDAGITGTASMRQWSLGTPAQPGQPLVNNALNLTLGGGSLPLVFITPPVPVPVNQLAAYIFGFNFDVDAPKIYARTSVYTKSSIQFMTARSPDRTAFRQNGGKMIIYHGLSDGVFSPLDTIRWYNAMDRRMGHAQDFVRLFLVPGMGHCGGGVATNSFSPFTALVSWVEKGIAPERLVASAGASTPWPGRTRPLCLYPSQARYSGNGSIEDAANFVCAAQSERGSTTSSGSDGVGQ